MQVKKISLLIVVLILCFIPFLVESGYFMHLIIMTLIWMMFSSSYNILLNAGQLSLSHNAFFAVAGYTSAIFMMQFGIPFLLCMVIGAIASTIFGLCIGKITIKMRGSYFVLVTFAFAEITRLTLNNWISVTNGPNGLRGVPVPEIFGYEFMSIESLYYMALALTLIIVYVSYKMLNGRFGRAFIALRTSEDLAEAVGIPHNKYILIATAVSCFLTGIAGSFYAHYVTLISPELSKFIYMINLLIMVIAGGRYTIGGPILGAALFVFFTESLRVFEMYRMLIFGVLLILVVTFMPQGIYAYAMDKIKQVLKIKTSSSI